MLYEFNHFGLSDYNEICCGENLVFQTHLHQSFEFVSVISGTLRVTVDGKDYFVEGNNALLIFPHQLHSISGEGCSHSIHIFSPGLVGAYTQEISGKIPQCNSFSPDKSLINSLNKLKDDASLIERKGLFYSLCAEFDKNAIYIDRKDDDKNLLYKIFKFVEDNYANDCSLHSLSEQLTFSYSYLSRYFKKTVGISFNSYVNQYRLSKACYLLTNTKNTILQCAFECGFSSLRSFNRNFIEYLCVTPKEYRNNSVSK